MPSISAAGIGSGLDINSLVDQLVAAERQPLANRLNLKELRAEAQLSAFGKLKSALAAFRDAVEVASGAQGFGQRLASSDREDLVTAKAATGAPIGNFPVEVIRLASAHRLASEAYADGDAVVGSGTLTFTVGEQSMDVVLAPGSDTLADLRNAINLAEDNPGITATIVNAVDGAHLVISSNATGAANEITVDRSGNKALRDFVNDLNEQSPAEDAEMLVDGFTVTSPDNEVSGAVEGITFSLQNAAPGETAQIRLSEDFDTAKASVEQFVEAWNTLQDTFSELTAFDATSGISGQLLGDSLTRNLSSALRREVSVVLSAGDLRMLADIGVETTVEGDLKLDAARLDDALAAEFDAVGDLFGGAEGIGTRIDTLLTPYLESGGQLATREDALRQELDSIEDRRAALDLRMDSVRQRYARQFSAMDELVAQLNSTGNFLLQQLGSLGG
ncbi:MAG: flagellar filament capping protein FliD [Gammaproteobacteria bacterium]